MASPLVPHVGEELWRLLGHAATIAYEPMPTADPALLVEDTVEYPVQVNGKVRSHVTVAADADPETVEAAALADAKVQAAIGRRRRQEGDRRPRPDGQRRHLTFRRRKRACSASSMTGLRPTEALRRPAPSGLGR